MKLSPLLYTFGLKALPGILLLTACRTASAQEQMTLAEQMAQDNPMVMFYVKHAPDDASRSPLRGVRISDGSLELKGAVLLDFLKIPSKKQHIYTFRTPDGERSYVWIDKGGVPLPIPPIPNDNSGENAYILSGDIYTHPQVYPGDGVVILPGGTLKWLEKLKSAEKN